MTDTLIDLIPAPVFFGVYHFWGIYASTAALIAACWLVFGLQWLRRHTLPKMPLITALAASVFGGLTLWLHNAEFIKMKLTLVDGAFAFVLLGSHVVGNKVLLARIPQTKIHMPDSVWRGVNLAWGLFFAASAALNFYVAGHFSEATWVAFKSYGSSLLMFVFLLGHIPFVGRYFVDEQPSN